MSEEDDIFDLEDEGPHGDLAPLDLRWLAAGVDGMLYTTGLVLGCLAGVTLVQILGARGSGAAMLAIGLTFGGWLVPVGLSWWLIVRDGQSIGKRWVDIRIVRTDGRLPGFVAGVLLRSWVTAALDQICGLWNLLDMMFILSANRRTLHDHLAGTKVVLGSVPVRRD